MLPSVHVAEARLSTLHLAEPAQQALPGGEAGIPAGGNKCRKTLSDSSRSRSAVVGVAVGTVVVGIVIWVAVVVVVAAVVVVVAAAAAVAASAARRQ